MKRFTHTIILALATLYCAPAFAIDYIVTRTDDPNPSGLMARQCRPDGGCTLRQAVLAANKRPGADRIVLERKKYRLTRTTLDNSIDGLAGPLWVSDDLEIIGGGSANTIIDWSNTLHHNHAVLVQGDTIFQPLLKLTNLTVARGRGENGGCILANGGEFSLDGVVIEHCRANKGGAIYSAAPILNLYESVIRHNHANNGGGIYFARSATVGTRVSMLANQAVQDGGAVYADGLNTYLTWRSESGPSEFNDNSAGRHGGAIALEGNVSFQMYSFPGITPRTKFLRNIAGERGGAIAALSDQSTVLLYGSLLEKNAAAQGGAIDALGSSMVITNSEFIGNQAQGGAGGAINLNFTTIGIWGTQIRRSSFHQNLAAQGGAIASTCHPIDVRDSAFWNNSAASGAAIFSSGNTFLAYVSSQNNGISATAATPPAYVKAFHTTCGNQAFKFVNSLFANGSCAAQSGSFSSFGGNQYSVSNSGCGFSANLDQQHPASAFGLSVGTFGGPRSTLGWASDGITRPQVNAGQSTYCGLLDSRGLPRSDGACDVGAFEQQP